MPKVDPNKYGKHPNPDGAGYLEVVPTSWRYHEADGSDVRVDRVKVFSREGGLVRTYLRDTLGMRFVDNDPSVLDDPSYLDTLKSSHCEKK